MNKLHYISGPCTPLHNQVLIKVDNTYWLRKSKGGILLANAAHEEAEADSPGYKLSEWIIRSGIVEKMPRLLTNGSYDWYPNKDDFREGDKVYWPIVRFFDYPVLQDNNDNVYLLVDYHDIYAKETNEGLIPVNGYYLFTPEFYTEKALEFEVKRLSQRFVLMKKSLPVIYEQEGFNNDTNWDEGDKCILMVPPIQLEPETGQTFDEKYFLAQKRHILISW